MTEARRREIALKIVKQMVLDKGLPPADQLRREIGNLAKKIEVGIEELMQFYQPFFNAYIRRAFAAQGVSLKVERGTQSVDQE